MRFCVICPTSRMKDDVRHLHELAEGEAFRFAGTALQLQLVEITSATCLVALPPKTKRKRIVPRFGDPVEFDQVQHGTSRCAPTAQVERLN